MKIQKISEAMLAMIGNAAGRITYKDRNAMRGNQTVVLTTAFTMVIHAIHKIFQEKYQAAKVWIAKIEEDYFNEQILLANEIIQENSRLYPYNFLGSAQSLLLLPNHYQRRSIPRVPDAVNHQYVPLSSVCRVIPLDRQRCELFISGNTEVLRVNIYDEANNLIQSEQITCQGNFSRMYDLKWTKAAAISLEVIGKNGVFRTGQL